MGRRPDYFGGSTIEYTKKGKHYDCIYRSIDGDCMKRDFMWFGEMCRNIGICKEYSPKSLNFNKKPKNSNEQKKKKKPVKTIKVIVTEDVAQVGDYVFIYSNTYNRNKRIFINDKYEQRSSVAQWAIGKSVGSRGIDKKNDFEIVKITKRKEEG